MSISKQSRGKESFGKKGYLNGTVEIVFSHKVEMKRLST